VGPHSPFLSGGVGPRSPFGHGGVGPSLPFMAGVLGLRCPSWLVCWAFIAVSGWWCWALVARWWWFGALARCSWCWALIVVRGGCCWVLVVFRGWRCQALSGGGGPLLFFVHCGAWPSSLSWWSFHHLRMRVLGRCSCLQALVIVRWWALFIVGAHCVCPLFKVVDGGGVIRDPCSWAVGFAGHRLSLFVGCGSFVAMAVICGVVVVVCGHSRGVVGSHCHVWAVIGC